MVSFFFGDATNTTTESCRQNIDAIEQELTETEKRVERLNEEMIRFRR